MRIAQVGSSSTRAAFYCDRGTETDLGIVDRFETERLDLCKERQEEEEEEEEERRGGFEVVLHCKRVTGNECDRCLIGRTGSMDRGAQYYFTELLPPRYRIGGMASQDFEAPVKITSTK